MAQNGFKRIFTSKAFLFALLLVFVWFGIKTVRMVYQKQELERKISNLKAEIERLDKSSQEFSQLMEYMKNPEFLEKEAKEKLNLKKEGENVVFVPEAAVSGISSGPSENQPGGKAIQKPAELDNNLIKWWKFFFGN